MKRPTLLRVRTPAAPRVQIRATTIRGRALPVRYRYAGRRWTALVRVPRAIHGESVTVDIPPPGCTVVMEIGG